jgi:hypothetical protein
LRLSRLDATELGSVWGYYWGYFNEAQTYIVDYNNIRCSYESLSSNGMASAGWPEMEGDKPRRKKFGSYPIGMKAIQKG